MILEAAWTIDIIKHGVYDTNGSKNSSETANSTFVNETNENILKINISKIFTLGFGVLILIMIIIKIIKIKKSNKKSNSSKKTLILFNIISKYFFK